MSYQSEPPVPADMDEETHARMKGMSRLLELESMIAQKGTTCGDCARMNTVGCGRTQRPTLGTPKCGSYMESMEASYRRRELSSERDTLEAEINKTH